MCGRNFGSREKNLVGSRSGGRLRSRGGCGDRFLVVDDLLEGGIQLIETMFLDDIADMDEVIGVGAVAGGEDVGNEFHA